MTQLESARKGLITAEMHYVAKREDLERRIDDLKLRKAALPTPEYRKQLQSLLIDLAKTQAEIDK